MKPQTVIALEYPDAAPTPAADAAPDPGYRKLRDGSQVAAFEALKNKQFAVLGAPTGWGKSTVLIALIADKLLRNPQLRCIVTVPQTIIGHNFAKSLQFAVPGHDGTLEWVVQNNLCSSSACDTIKNVKQFLSRRPGILGTLGSRVLVCTHATIAIVYKQLKAKGDLGLLKNLILWIDEGHHVANAQVVKSEEIVSNSMGSLTLHCVEHANLGLHVGLASATLYRSDLRHILPEKVMHKFASYKIPFDIYMKEVKPVKGFEFNIVCGETFQMVEQLLKNHCPTIIYLAKRQSRHATECKYKEVKRIKQIIGKDAQVAAQEDGPVTVVGGRRILDLVTEKGRRERQDYLTQTHARVDVIVALDTCKEGFDWPKAEQSIIVGERQSLPEMVQIIGRLMRKSPGKKSAKIFQILPVAVPEALSVMEDRNTILTATLSAMLLRDVLQPVEIRNVNGRKTTDLPPEEPQPKDGVALMKDFLIAVQGLDYEQSRKVAGQVLSRHGIDESKWGETWERLWRRFGYVARQVEGLTSDVSFEILKKVDISAGYLKLASGLCGAMTLQELRETIGRAYRTPEEWVIVARDLAEKNGGMLPNREWLEKNGFSGLVCAMRERPELFKLIKQESKIKRTKEWLLIAEDVAEKNGGPLPCASRIKREHGGLYQAMQRHPEAFAHFKQEKFSHTTPEEWLPIAEALAEKHGGLPSRRWLEKNKYSGLIRVMRMRPDLFAHIKRLAA